MDRTDLDRHWAAGLAFGDLPDEAARRFGDREALAFRGRRYSFRQIAAEVDRLARGLIHVGVEPGERVCLWLNNCPEWMFAMLALARIGAVHVPINTRFRVADLQYVDMALLRPDGYMRFVGRYKDMLKVGGENVDPMEVEGHRLRHPGLRQVAVVACPDARLGEVPVAFASLSDGARVTAEELIASCRGRIASFKIPRHVFFMDELPETSSGKIRKVELREEARRRLAG